MTIEQIPHWLNAAVLAAGMATVYNADDWDRAANASAASSSDSTRIPQEQPKAAP